MAFAFSSRGQGKHLRAPLKPFFGDLRLDAIRAGKVNEFRARLAENERLTFERSRNNILTVLASALKYAVEAEVIDEAPRIRLFRYERPELEWWRLDEYARLITAARKDGPSWLAAVCLGGECGLRAGEIRGLRWREDVDLVGRVISINRQLRRGDASSRPCRRTRPTPRPGCSRMTRRRVQVGGSGPGPWGAIALSGTRL